MENTLESIKEVAISTVKIENEDYFRISNVDAMRPFFMSIVSDSDHWMFISSNGGLTAGRKNAEFALFPYYTDDKITESADTTGSKSIFLIRQTDGQLAPWEPFSERFEGRYQVRRNLYKNIYGNKILFEEINLDLGLTYRYQWCSSDVFGFVRTSKLINNTNGHIGVSILDGIQNILPFGVGSHLQNNSSNLVDAYKRSELEEETGLGIFALSAIIVDKAEPSEALKANVVWSIGLEQTKHLLSSSQLKNFRRGMDLHGETDVKAEKGAYFIHTQTQLSSHEEKEWMIVADVNKNHAAVAKISETIQQNQDLVAAIKNDIVRGTNRLIALNAASDGIQLTEDYLKDARHFSNTLFNIMRGGIFDHNYQIEKWDFCDYLSKGNKEAFAAHSTTIDALADVFSVSQLLEIAHQSTDSNFKRLCLEYMPLKFSRRHGDPSRPWNRFSINTRNELDGSKILDYQGNWRDIFQNWEALALSYPEFIESMIHKFLNATTFDGYNPYRVTKDGFDWETIEPDDPWSYIGYWGDHQIIYLLKLLELSEKHHPGNLTSFLNTECFVYANVPYRIKGYQDILNNPKDTIDFDHDSDQKIRLNRSKLGADGALLTNQNHTIHHVNFMEKILATVLAKLSNFIPEGGIWMNTQRPEWNDANNALVGNGVSMVTLYYLRRFLSFFKDFLANSSTESVTISEELKVFFNRIMITLDQNRHLLEGQIKGKVAKQVLDGLGQAGSDYRLSIYDKVFSGNKLSISIADVNNFLDLGILYLEHSIRANKRADHLYHAYNLVTFSEENELSISYLSEMLEGQVAVLSSGYLSSEEALTLLDGLKRSQLFREDQYSYILYPNKDLPGFNKKNNIPDDLVNQSTLLKQLVADGHVQIIEKDTKGRYHFNGNFKNANFLSDALDDLANTSYANLVASDKKLVLRIYEELFNHKAFTGRSGTFFGYEGLGSIYWHMVSKLQLAVQECCLKAIEEGANAETIGRLLEHFYEINAGIGVHKSPTLYGAFPTDPYSHTPAGKGAQQPGMTGQVKEDILSRFGELGVFINQGKLEFNPCLLRKDEFLSTSKVFEYYDIHQNKQQFPLAEGTLCFTYCQVPIVYRISDQEKMTIFYQNDTTTEINALELDLALSKELFERTGMISRIEVQLNSSRLR